MNVSQSIDSTFLDSQMGVVKSDTAQKGLSGRQMKRLLTGALLATQVGRAAADDSAGTIITSALTVVGIVSLIVLGIYFVPATERLYKACCMPNSEPENEAGSEEDRLIPADLDI